MKILANVSLKTNLAMTSVTWGRNVVGRPIPNVARAAARWTNAERYPGTPVLVMGRETPFRPSCIGHRCCCSAYRMRLRGLVLQDGLVAEQGTHAKLLGRGALYARLHDLQHGPVVAGWRD